jgi:hypothetical protein
MLAKSSGLQTSDQLTVAGAALALHGMFHAHQIPSLRHDALHHSHLLLVGFSLSTNATVKSTNCVTD